MPRNEIDRSALAKVAVGHLGQDLPAVGNEKIDGGSHQRGVALVKQAIDRATAPSDVQVGTRLESAKDESNGAELGSIAVPALKE